MAKTNKTISLDQDVVEYLSTHGNASLLITELLRDHKAKNSKTVLEFPVASMDLDQAVEQAGAEEVQKQSTADLKQELEARRQQMVLAFKEADRSDQYIAFAKWFKAAYPTANIIQKVEDLELYVKELEKVYVRCFEVV
jgi:hypothetical protein